jgi:RHS repeat-associated protein
MTARTSFGTQRMEFEYDVLGRRIKKTVFSSTSGGIANILSTAFYLYDGWNLIAEINGSQRTLLRGLAWGLDLSGSFQGAGGVRGLLWVNNAQTGPGIPTGIQWVAYEANGNVSALVDSGTGTYSARYEYGPFGELIRATGSLAKLNPFRFSTKFTDNETGLLYYGYRYYNPVTGKWLSRDPIGELGGVNLYGMVGNDPNSYVDYFGLWWLGPYWIGQPPTWIDSNGNYHYDTPPSQRPPTDDSFQGDIDSDIAALSGRLGGVQKVCKTISTTANTALSFTPQNTFSEVVLRESLSGKEVGPGGRLLAAGMTLPGGFVVKKVVGKTVTACCGKVTICLFIPRHHLIPKTRFANHDLVQAAGVNIEKDASNLVDLLNHGGDHTEDYYKTVQQLMDDAYREVQAGKMTAGDAYQGVCKTLREGITDGSISPYRSKNVYPDP